MSFKIGLVGATGVVGQTFLQLIEERSFPVAELRPFASENSRGDTVTLSNQQWTLDTLHDGCFSGLDLVFFSSGDAISKEWAPKAVEDGAWAVDNSAAYRMDPDTPLVVPEVNFTDDLKAKPCLIANPNCSTIQLVVLLQAFKKLGMKSVRVASYQAVSGAGREAITEMNEMSKNSPKDIRNMTSEYFGQPIAYNCVPEIGSFDDHGWTSEERKIRLETKKILDLPKLPVSAFCVRVAVHNGHSEAAWIEFNDDVEKPALFAAMEEQEGLVNMERTTDTPAYQTALYADGENPVYIGRTHKDLDFPNTWKFWIAADNLRKGAALNGIQIAEKLLKSSN